LRHPNHPNQAIAAFTLGRLAQEQEHDFPAAARWFQTYLASASQGSLAEAARGRLFQALRQSGNANEARRAAATYLEHHPKGSHAGAARSLLQNRE
jgi:hypothetical protein